MMNEEREKRAVMVCIGCVNRGGTLVTTRLEIEFVLEGE
jgi:hypothetical protein